MRKLTVSRKNAEAVPEQKFLTAEIADRTEIIKRPRWCVRGI
jgi:hypothetical protein